MLTNARRSAILAELKELESKMKLERGVVSERLAHLGVRRSSLINELYR